MSHIGSCCSGFFSKASLKFIVVYLLVIYFLPYLAVLAVLNSQGSMSRGGVLEWTQELVLL